MRCANLVRLVQDTISAKKAVVAAAHEAGLENVSTATAEHSSMESLLVNVRKRVGDTKEMRDGTIERDMMQRINCVASGPALADNDGKSSTGGFLGNFVQGILNGSNKWALLVYLAIYLAIRHAVFKAK